MACLADQKTALYMCQFQYDSRYMPKINTKALDLSPGLSIDFIGLFIFEFYKVFGGCKQRGYMGW